METKRKTTPVASASVASRNFFDDAGVYCRGESSFETETSYEPMAEGDDSGSDTCAPIFHGVRPLLYQFFGSDPEF